MIDSSTIVVCKQVKAQHAMTRGPVRMHIFLLSWGGFCQRRPSMEEESKGNACESKRRILHALSATSNA